MKTFLALKSHAVRYVDLTHEITINTLRLEVLMGQNLKRIKWNTLTISKQADGALSQ